MKLPDRQDLLLGTSNGSLFKLSVYSNNELKIQNIINTITVSYSIYINYYDGSDYFFSLGEMGNSYIFSVNIHFNRLLFNK